MSSTLKLAEHGLTVAAILVGLALVVNLIILTAKRPVATRVNARVKVGVGAGSKPEPGSGGGSNQGSGSGGGTGSADHTSATGYGAVTPATPKFGALTTYATAFSLIAWVTLTAYLVVRSVTVGHGPFANQHEFAVAFTWGILLAYLIGEWRFNLRILSVIVLPVALALLAYGLRLDTEVVPLVPALQNSTLLTLHVGFAVLAYGAACVSFGAAVAYLAYPRVKFLRAKSLETYDTAGYKAAVVTFPLLTAMILLGALWADTAWGSYWSWDPKETAALVTWLIYGAFLHARVVRGWRGRKSAWLLVIGFAAVLFAYFGNHFFGGLHSYA